MTLVLALLLMLGSGQNRPDVEYSGVVWPDHPSTIVHRSPQVRSEFQRSHPCPSTGKRYGACPGYVVDHIKPLACGGPDSVSNMQWQTVAEAKAKDKIERKGCK